MAFQVEGGACGNSSAAWSSIMYLGTCMLLSRNEDQRRGGWQEMRLTYGQETNHEGQSVLNYFLQFDLCSEVYESSFKDFKSRHMT